MATDSFFRQIKKIKNKEQYQNGFTVIELIVIVSIFAIMASVSLYNFQGFDDSTNINNLALDIALEIKRAQTLGSSSIDTDTGDKSAMSVIFSSESGGVFQQQFKIVREFPIAGSYGELGYVSSLDIVDRESRIFGGRIKSICLTDGNGCANGNIVTNDISISFRRPYTEPIITSIGCAGLVNDIRSHVQYDHVCLGSSIEIILESSDTSRVRTIVIEPTGNIYTHNN